MRKNAIRGVDVDTIGLIVTMLDMKSAEPIVLASMSPRRKRIFEEMGIEIEVSPADIDEECDGKIDPVDFAVKTAAKKARTVAERLAEQGRRPWIVAADTIVVVENEVLGKPADAKEAKSMLSRLSGRTHTVITGWTVGVHLGEWVTGHSETAVTFHGLTKAQIEGYVATGEGADKAGAYAVQGIGAFLVDRIDGDYFNVVGLPVSRVVRALIDVGAVPAFLKNV